MANKNLYIPLINPVKFFETTRQNLPKFYTKHLDYFPAEERVLDWQTPNSYVSVWQTTDIIELQFESEFDPIIVEVINLTGSVIHSFPALIGLPNAGIPGAYACEVSINLGALGITESGCYKILVYLGASGPEQRTLISDSQYISVGQIENSLLIEYKNSRFHEDVMFETGINFQKRILGHFGFLEPGRNSINYRNQKYDSVTLDSRTTRQMPVYFGDEYGIPDEEIDLLNRIFSCDSVRIDNKFFGATDGSKFEFTEVDSTYPKRGVKLMVEEGINRNSRVFSIDADTTKRLITTVIVDAAVFGDTSNQGSSNTIPVFNVIKL